MQWYEVTSKKLEVGHCYSHQELINLLKSDYPLMRDSSYHWDVCGMLKSGNLTKVARNVYVVRNEREKPVYRPAYSDLAVKLTAQVSDKYALAEIIQNQKAFIPTNDGKNGGIKPAADVGINREAVIKILKKQPHATAKSLAEAINLSPRQVERVLAELKKEGKIVRKGSNKSGWWEVN